MSARLARLIFLPVILFSLCQQLHAEDPRPEPGKFPSTDLAKSYRGELVFVDHVNRRGSLRLHIDGVYKEISPHPFAMLPYGMIYFRGAPAQLEDIPLGTVMYGRFYLPPEPATSVVPIVKQARPGQPRENHAILLEDGPSLCLREGKAWKLREVEIKDNEGHLTATLKRADGGEGLGGEHQFTIDGSTRVWRGRELLGIEDLVSEGTWPADGSKKFDDRFIHLALAWHPRYLYQQFHVSDLWLDDDAIKVATERQRQRHIRHIRLRWMPGKIDAIEYRDFGDAVVTATLFGGMDQSLYDEFQLGTGAKMAAAENTLRTWWPNHDGMDGKISHVKKMDGQPELGSSGLQVKVTMPLILEGFRPGRIVRIRLQDWPNVKPPIEERIRSLEDRWPSPDLFNR